MLFIALCVVVIPVQAQELKATSTNLQFLGSQGQWAQYRASPLQELLLYSSTSNFGVVSKKKVSVTSRVSGVGTIGAVKVNEILYPQSIYDGQCVSFVKAVSKTPNIPTSKWTKGRNAVTNRYSIPAGTIIATFNSYGKYSGHCAIFGNPSSTGINVWDQNYIYSKVVGRHCIAYSGSGTSDADNYYVVNIP
jgi:hypothetical protein